MKPVAIEINIGDILEDTKTGEILRIDEISLDYGGYDTWDQTYRVTILKQGTDWRNIEPGTSFWLDKAYIHWQFKKLPQSHPAYILFGQ